MQGGGRKETALGDRKRNGRGRERPQRRRKRTVRKRRKPKR